MAQSKPSLPAGSGELLVRPAFEAWARLAKDNHRVAQGWAFEVATRPAGDVRAQARAELLAVASGFSGRLGVPVDAPGDPADLIVMTGHQPEIYHPGVWVKDFLLQSVADQSGATAVDVVVDSDGFDSVGVSFPCLVPEVRRCTQTLAVASKDECFASAPVPSAEDVEQFCEAVERQVSTLPTPAVAHCFAVFAQALRGARQSSGDLGEYLTKVRRHYEASAGTRYLELPATMFARTEAFATFVVDLALSGERFVSAYNSALADYRRINGVRSDAQPFPDLAQDGGRVELPLWAIVDGRRSTLWVRRLDDELEFSSASDILILVPADPERATAALSDAAFIIAPKALSLTLFIRAFACDLFIHGVGGGGYDRVTDDVFRRYYGVEPPEFVVASVTMYLPLGARIVGEDEVSAARERLNRLEHNPDAMLGEVEFESVEEQAEAASLAEQKAELVGSIAKPDADKKTLGLRIREVNAALASMLAPLKESLRQDVEALEVQRAASDVLTDRTYPYCFWPPRDVAELAGQE